MKAWALQWREDGTLTTQAKIAGTSSHHPFVIAECIHRRLSADLVTAVAYAHDPPTTAARAAYIRAGAILAGVDPIAAGYLNKEGELIALPSLEANINHLSDHDYVLADPAAIAVNAALSRLFTFKTPAEARWHKAMIKSRIPHIKLYALLRARGDWALLEEYKTEKLDIDLPRKK
jgi:hypothetical protein